MTRLRAVCLICAAAIGCAAPTPERAAQAPTISVAPAAVSSAPAAPASVPPAIPQLLGQLAAGARYGDGAHPEVLYTWTHADQIETLRRDRRLLIRSRSPDGTPALFDTRVAAYPVGLASLLRRPELSLRRFAWSNPWATLAGWKGESYGDRLIRVELRPEALILCFDTTTSTAWRVVDLGGAPVLDAEALAHPERIGAVYHVWPGDPAGAGAPNASPFREYVLVNESMVEQWQVATPTIASELREARALLERLESSRAAMPPDVVALWRHKPAEPTLAELYAANLAFPNERYQLAPDRVAVLVALLGAAIDANRGAAISVTPLIRFADQGKRATP